MWIFGNFKNFWSSNPWIRIRTEINAVHNFDFSIARVWRPVVMDGIRTKALKMRLEQSGKNINLGLFCYWVRIWEREKILDADPDPEHFAENGMCVQYNRRDVPSVERLHCKRPNPWLASSKTPGSVLYVCKYFVGRAYELEHGVAAYISHHQAGQPIRQCVYTQLKIKKSKKKLRNKILYRFFPSYLLKMGMDSLTIHIIKSCMQCLI